MSAPDSIEGDGLPTAGEYVLGVLDQEARIAFDTRLGADPGLRAEVAAWEEKLSPLAESVAPVAPPPTLWPALERAIVSRTPMPSGTPGVVVVLQRRLRVWRAATTASLALAAALATAVVLPVTQRTPAPVAQKVSGPAPMMLASLTPASGGRAAVFMATFDRSRRELMIAPVSDVAHPGRAPELWLLPKGGKPTPLGIAGFGAPVRFEMAADVGQPGRTLLAVSLEPPGGSPTGQPTGPVIATGELRPL